MESAANNNQANREEIQMRRAVNEDIKEHPGIGKKLPSNLKLKSLLKEAIKRGQDTAASQKALGTDIPKDGTSGKTGQKSSSGDNKESHQPDDHPRIKSSESKPRGTSTEQKQERNTQPGNMASAGPRWSSAMDYGLKSHHEERKVKIKKKKKGRLESQTETKDPADNGSLIIVGGLIGGMFLFLAIGAVFYCIWKNCRKRIGRDRGDPERGRLSASNQAIAEDGDEDIIFERKPKGWKKKNKKEDKEDSPGKKVGLNLEVSQSPPPKGILEGGHDREIRVNMELSDSSQPASLSSLSAPSQYSSLGTPHSTPTIGSSMEYITLVDSRKDSYLRVWMPQMQSSGSSSSSDVKIEVDQVAPPKSLNISAACRQLTSTVTTETGGSNSSSESCKTPVAVSNDVITTIDDDDDCKVPLLSSENEGSSAEVIYVSMNHLTTEATGGDGNDVKERTGEPPLPPDQAKPPSYPTDVTKAASHQLTSTVTTETGGSNSSSESCKTPVAVSNDVITTVDDDDDCTVPLLSSENEGSSAEVIYVSMNHLTTEATGGDGNDVKERTGEPPLPPDQAKPPSYPTDVAKAASRQLTSMVTTETGGSNSSSESCKTPVAVSNDVITTIDDDDDCKVPLLSSENESSSAEMIYVSRNHLTTEATKGDGNDVKEQPGKSPIGGYKALEDLQLTHLTLGHNYAELHEDPNEAPSQILFRNKQAKTGINREKRRVIKERTKSIILDEAMEKARDLKCIKRRRIIRKGLSLRSDTSLSDGVTLAQAVILPTPVDPKKIKRDTERLKVNKELLKNCVNPSFGDVIQVVASTIRSDAITRDLREKNDYNRYLIAVDAKGCALKNEKPTFQMDIQFVRNIICGRSSLDHGENPETGCVCSFCVKQRSKTGRPDSAGGPDCLSILQDIPATDDTFVIGGKVFTIFVPKQSSSGNAGPSTSTGSDTAHTE
ncbi:uncharacterized protein LOC111338153 [Stylophora pistillata]|uniref:uncharacterized protein LOC111338153 n=1 Tax=Stylophora pistillata TaxID=50429 RepID=UPI000C049A51|nr:uncharacterized protein LOC111338153 [Stylophora pistillata]